MYWSNGSTSVVEAKRLPSEITVGGDWSVRFDPDWGPKEAVVFPELISWTESPEPLIRYYSGKAVYENAFDLDKDQIRGRKVLLRMSVPGATACRSTSSTFGLTGSSETASCPRGNG